MAIKKVSRKGAPTKKQTPKRASKNQSKTGRAARSPERGKRVIAETGAGQHGVATATAAALFGLLCSNLADCLCLGAKCVLNLRYGVFGETPLVTMLRFGFVF